MTVYLPVWYSHCTKPRFTVLMSYSGDQLAIHLCPLLCQQRQDAKFTSKLSHCWSLLRNNNMATNFQRLSSSSYTIAFCRMWPALPDVLFFRQIWLFFHLVGGWKLLLAGGVFLAIFKIFWRKIWRISVQDLNQSLVHKKVIKILLILYNVTKFILTGHF